MKRRLWFGAVAVFAALVVAGALVASVDDRSAEDSAGDTATGAPASVGGEAASDDGGAAEGGGTGVVPALDTGPRVVKTADLRLEVGRGDFAEVVDRVQAVAEGNGGFVVTSSTSSFEEGRAAGEVTVRVPAAAFDATRRALADLGELESEQVGGEDVSSQLVDLGARLRSLRAEEQVLNDLLGRAANVGEVLQVRDRLVGVRTEIEQLAAREAALDDAASFSTVRVSLFEPGGAALPEGDLARSWERAVDGAESVIGGMIVVVGWTAPVAVLAGIVWLALRARPRRRHATAG